MSANNPLNSSQKTSSRTVITAIIFILVLGAIVFFARTKEGDAPKNDQKKNDGDKIVSAEGMHWHSDLEVTILGEKQEIPVDVGLGSTHKPLHTHEDKKVHMEFSGTVRERDIMLGKFFENWGKKFSSDCLLDKCNGSEGKVTMKVNGEANKEFEKYVMKDGDKIEVAFEASSTVPEAIKQNQPLANQPSQVKEITVAGNDFSFSPALINVKGGEPVRIIFKNEGKETHNLVIQGLNQQTKVVNAGQVDVLEFTAPVSGIYDILCGVGDHRVKGMVGKFIVEQ